jgi:rhodanese-related sulfurtransferase
VSRGRPIDQILADARARLDRVEAAALADEVAGGALLVDIRPLEQRQRDGELTAAIVIDRNVLEWRLDPASENAITEASYDRRVIIVCNEGYSSSLAAATLQDVGVARATDLIGGYQAWIRYTRLNTSRNSSTP